MVLNKSQITCHIYIKVLSTNNCCRSTVLFIRYSLPSGVMCYRGDGVNHVLVLGPVLLLMSRRPALCSLVLRAVGYIVYDCSPPLRSLLCKEQYFSEEEIVLLRNIKS